MTVIVKKYGGTSVSSISKIKKIANQIAVEKKKSNDILVVLSAMGDTTDKLVQMSNKSCKDPEPRELDMLLSSGEQVSISLLSLILNDIGVKATSFTGWQAGIKTNSQSMNARISSIDVKRIKSEFKKNHVVIVAGFQGINNKGDITTLGRGGSDTTAVALAAALKAFIASSYSFSLNSSPLF